MKELQTEIDGYKVELNLDMNGDGMDSPDKVTGCWITKGNYSSSLAALQGEGVLANNSILGDFELKVPDNVINKIAAWAEANGY